MDFASLPTGTRRSSSVGILGPSQQRSYSGNSDSFSTSSEARRSSIKSLAGSDVRRRSSAINLNFDSRKSANKAVDEPILLCKEDDGYLFFSMSSDGTLNYKVASKVSGSMTQYLVDPATFNSAGAPVVVLASPTSGTGLATSAYTRLLLPIFKHFRIAHSHIGLTDGQTASYLAENGQFTPDTIFILLSGDGVIHEVINGLAQNPHFEHKGSTIKLCPIPCGSGNGLAASLRITSLAQGIRAVFKDNFSPLQVMSVHSTSLGRLSYAAVVVSYGLHAGILNECAKPNDLPVSTKFQEAAKKLLYPAPYLYSAELKLTDACKFPDFNGAQTDFVVGDEQHTYCLITRCSNLEADWKIAPMANPVADNGKLDVIRMGQMSGSELQTILMDGYKAGAQINRPKFEYYRASGATIHVTESQAERRIVCIDGALHRLDCHDELAVNVVSHIGSQQLCLSVHRL